MAKCIIIIMDIIKSRRRHPKEGEREGGRERRRERRRER